MEETFPNTASISVKDKLSTFFASFFSSQTTRLALFVIVAITLPLFVFVAMQQQDNRQQASENGSVTFIDPTTNQAITQTTTPDIKIQVTLPDGWELTQTGLPTPTPAGTSTIQLLPMAFAQTPSTEPTSTPLETLTPEPTITVVTTPTPSTDTPTLTPVTQISDIPSPTIQQPSPTGQTTTQQRILEKMIIRNTDTGTGGQERTTIENPQEIITALSTGILWKLNPLSTNETSGTRNVTVQFYGYDPTTGPGQIIVLNTQATITLLQGITQSPSITIEPTVTPETSSPSATITTSPSTIPTSPSIVPTMTLAPTPTPVAGAMLFHVKFALSGIGENGNKTPIYPQKDVTITLFDSNNTKVIEKTGKITFNATSNLFEGTIDMGTIPQGVYIVKAQIKKYLIKTIANILTISPATTSYTITGVGTLIPGDSNGDNKIDIQDYNAYRECVGKTTESCVTTVDFNDDGRVDSLIPVPEFADYKLFIQSLSTRTGD